MYLQACTNAQRTTGEGGIAFKFDNSCESAGYYNLLRQVLVGGKTW